MIDGGVDLPDASPDATEETAEISTSTATVALTEGGAAGTFTVVLTAAPGASVDVAVASGDTGAVTVSPATLTFTDANFDTAQTVTVTPIDDDDAGNESVTITLSATGMTDQTVTATVTDDDTQALVVNMTTVTVTEGNTTGATVGVTLAAQPTSDVTVTVTSDDTGAATASPASLTFTSANWSTAQDVTIVGVDDADTADESVTVTIASTGLTSQTVDVTVTDDDTLNISATPGTINLTEGGATATLSVVLTQQPPGAVAVAVGSSDTGAVGLSAATLNFDNTNWSTPQTVTVSAVDDNDAQDESVTVTASATGLTSQTVAVNVTDDETQGIVLSTATLAITEGATGVVNVTLAANPLASVSVTVATSDAGAAALSTTTLTFDATDWNVAHPVTVTGVQDDDLAGESVTVTMASTGLTNQTVAVTVTDDDTQSLVVSPSTSLPVTEGASNTISVRLAFQPAATVTVNAASGNTGIATVTPASVSFNTTDWNMPKTFTVAGVDDVDLVNETTTVTISSTGLTSVPITVNVTDDDAQRIVVTPVSATLTEGGSSQNFAVTLAFDPGGPVTVNAASSDPGAAAVTSSALSFDSTNFSVPQTATVAPQDDPNTDDESVNITFSATGIANTVIPVTVNDDDNQALILSTNTLTVQEEGATASFTVRLAFDPVNPVTVTVSTSDAGAASVDLTSFTFNTGNYQTPRTINVAGVSDPDLVDEMVTITVSTAIAPSAAVDVTVTEDDLQSLIVTHASPFEVTEDIGPRNFTVQLEYQPATTVGVTVASDNTAAANVSATSLLFTTTNYNVARTITVTGTTDPNLHDTSANVSVQSPGLTGTTFGVTVFDDDEQDIIVLPSNSVTVDEESTFGVTIALAFEPYCEQASPGCTETVTLTSSDTDAATVSTGSIGFTLANYTTPVPVTITGIDDLDILNENETITLDSNEVNTTDESIAVNVLDNDTQNFQFDMNSATSLIEEDEPGTIGVRLTQDPVTDQIVTITTADATTMTVRPNGGGGTGTSTTLTFTTANYTTFQYVEIEAIADIDLLDENVDVTFSTPTVATDVDRTIEVFDNDQQVILLHAAASGGSPISDLNVDEAGTSTFYVSLAFQPSAPVTVNLSESAAQISLDTSSIDFTGANFQTRVPVIVTGEEDSPEDLNDHLDLAVTVATTGVTAPESASATLLVDQFDTDIQEILVTLDPADFPISIQEGGPTDNFFVALAFPPRDNVVDVVQVDSPNGAELLVNGSSSFVNLNFSSGTWSIPQEVVVTALDDYDFPSAEADDLFDVGLDIPTEAFGPSGGDVVPVDVPVTVIDDEITIIHDVTITSMDGATRYTKRQNVNWFDTLVGVTAFDASSPGDVVLATAPRDALGTLAPTVTVGNATGVSDPVQVIEYDGDNMGVFISDATDGIVYARYTTDLASELTAPTAVSGTDSIDFWPSFDGSQYGLVYRDANDDNLRFRTVQVDGSASGSTIITVPTASAHQHPNLHPRSGGGWVVFYTTTTAVRCVRLNASGAAIGGSDVALPGLPAAAFVSSVANPDTGTVMLAYNDPTDGLSAAEVNPELCEVLAVRAINYNGGQLFNAPFIAYNGYEYKVVYDLIDGTMGVTTLTANGRYVDDVNVGTGSRPSIAWAGDRWVLRAQGSIVMQSGSFQTHCNDGEQNEDETGPDCGGSDCVPCVVEFSFTSTSGDDIPVDALYDFMLNVQGVVGPNDAIQFAITRGTPLRGGGANFDGWCADGNADWYVGTYIDMFDSGTAMSVNAPTTDMYNLCTGETEWSPAGTFSAQNTYNGYWDGGFGSWELTGGTSLGIDPGSTNGCELRDPATGCSNGAWTFTLRIGAGNGSNIADVCTAGSGFTNTATCNW